MHPAFTELVGTEVLGSLVWTFGIPYPEVVRHPNVSVTLWILSYPDDPHWELPDPLQQRHLLHLHRPNRRRPHHLSHHL